MKFISAELVELRGMQLTHPKKQGGKDYVMCFVEEMSGNPEKFVCKDLDILNTSVKKGDMVRLLCDKDSYGNLVLLAMNKKTSE